MFFSEFFMFRIEYLIEIFFSLDDLGWRRDIHDVYTNFISHFCVQLFNSNSWMDSMDFVHKMRVILIANDNFSFDQT